jgi:hypothetical protein
MRDLTTSIKPYLRRVPWLDRWIRLYLLRRRTQTVAYPNWTAMLRHDRAAWFDALAAAKDGPPVLVATTVGGYSGGVMLESLLAVALTLRKANVEVLLCDKVLPACLQCEVGLYPQLRHFARHGPREDLCGYCFDPAAQVYRSLGIHVHTLSSCLLPDDYARAATITRDVPSADIGRYTLDGLAVGEHALAGALRFFARADLDGTACAEAVLRRYFHAALLTVFAVRRLIRARRYHVAVFHHGIYVPQGLTGEVCRQEGVRVVNWNPAYRKQCFIFSHGDTYHHTLMHEPVEKWENMPWSDEMESSILGYLKSRWHGTNDWIWFHERPVEHLGAIARQIGVDFSKPCVGMLTNVMWDAQLHYPANAFANMREWVLQTIAYFSRRPDLQLLIRIHPAEVRGTLPSRQPILSEIRHAFPRLPPNVFIIPPESRVSTYAAMAHCNAVVIYGTKTGVELTSMGIPVIVAGEAWIRNKGVTLDARSADDYFALLDRLPLPSRMDEAKTRRSRRYAYHFFFRRMIPIEFLAPAPGNPPFRVDVPNLDALQPGRSVGLDVVCDGILRSGDFIYPAEAMAAGPTRA